MERNRLIVWWSKNKKLLGAFNSVEEASQKTGINQISIFRNLEGITNDCPNGTRFTWEVLASDLRKKK